MPFTLDDYYPRDSTEALSWLYVQKYTHTHHVTWKHVAYAARYDALLSFFRSHSTLRAPRSPTSPVSNEDDDGEHDQRTKRSDSVYSTSSLLSTSSHASSSTSLSTPSPTSRISSLPIIDPQSIPSSTSNHNDTRSTSTSSDDCREKLYTTPDSSNIIYIPPRTLADLADVLGRLAMSYMLTHISYLRESLKGSDFSTMKSIALGGLRELMLRESTRSTSFVGQVAATNGTITSSPSSSLSSLATSSEIGSASGSSSSLASSGSIPASSENTRRSSTSSAAAERRPSTTSTDGGSGEQQRRNVGQDWLRLFDGRDEWDGKTPTLDLRGSPPALSRQQQLPRSNPYPRNEVHRGGLKA